MQEHLDGRLRTISPSAAHDLIAKIAEIDEFRGWWVGRGLSNAATLKRLRMRVVAVSAAASARIGGTPANHAWAAAQEGYRPSRSATLDGRNSPEALGCAELLRAVFDGYEGMRPVGQALILQFHARLLKYSHKDQSHRGKFKTVPDAGRTPVRRMTESPALRSVDPDLTPRAVTVATEWLTGRLATGEFHPLLVIAGFILEFLAIRPFVDGNGRLSRILTHLLLLQCGYTHVPYVSLERIIAERWTEYYFALRRSQANTSLQRPDITPWLCAFLDAMRVQIEQLRGVVNAQADDGLLSPNQLAVLKLLERNGEVTNRLICSELDIPRETVKQLLNRLVALNVVQRLGAGRAIRYCRTPLHEGGAAR